MGANRTNNREMRSRHIFKHGKRKIGFKHSGGSPPEVSRIGVEPLARDGLPPFLLYFVAAEAGEFVLQGAPGWFMRSRAVRVAAVVLYGYAFRVCPLAGECPFCRGRSTQGHVRWVAWGYPVKPGESHACWSAVVAAVEVC